MLTLIFAAALLSAVGTADAGIFGSKDKSKSETAAPAAPPAPVMPPVIQSKGAVSGISTNTRTVARAHMRFENPNDEKQLMSFIAARRRAQEDFVVVSRLIEEKQLEISTFNEQMQKEFGVDKDKNYQFEAETGTIFELILKASAAEQQKTQQVVNADQLKSMYDFNVHRKLSDEKDRTRFLRLAAGKQLAGDQIKMLTLIQNEKEIENQSIHEEMARRYAISLDREYRYDNDSKTLFELVTIPADYVEPVQPDASVKRK